MPTPQRHNPAQYPLAVEGIDHNRYALVPSSISYKKKINEFKNKSVSMSRKTNESKKAQYKNHGPVVIDIDEGNSQDSDYFTIIDELTGKSINLRFIAAA